MPVLGLLLHSMSDDSGTLILAVVSTPIVLDSTFAGKVGIKVLSLQARSMS